MHAIRLFPKEDATNGWSRILPARAPAPPLKGDQRADWLVIGAGFAGLAAARRLAENRPNDRILLIDAHEVGEGASGRNSGFAIDLPHNVGGDFAELAGSQRYIRLSRAAIAALEDAVTRHGIECDWRRRGKYHGCSSIKGHREVLEPFAKELTALGEPFRWLDRAALAKELGTDYFHSALHTPGCVLVNPAALVRGLAASLPANVTLHEHTAVTKFATNGAIRAETPHGTIDAKAAILTVNGWAKAFGFFRQSLMPMAAYASLSRPLNDAEHAALGGIADWGLTPANALAGVTMRYTPDRRILVRQRFCYAPRFTRPDGEWQKVRADHERILHARFPMLPKVTIEHTWRGFVCLSRNQAPGFGRIAPNLYAAVCQNAVGVTKGTIGGLLAADLATGRDNALLRDMESLGTPARLPPRPFLDLGVRARFAAELWRWRSER
ncbi:MAG: FAD-binding oxidoreductase [Alphaproteobacteria bacterium]|nr:FAD-binding oxidoreductase [Alphaproteobacteria bacterium]